LGKVQVISKQTTSWWFSKGFRKRRNCSCQKGRATILYGKDLPHLDQAKNDESSLFRVRLYRTRTIDLIDCGQVRALYCLLEEIDWTLYRTLLSLPLELDSLKLK
uniref:Uncharacterized protein n=1 Tax=Solanum lycopersicum TaxID=4081 RepID=A0A3Q7HZZ2_SOLLC